jgi:MoaA/NifB/PqqE/SkfB family radical SAM enzyme
MKLKHKLDAALACLGYKAFGVRTPLVASIALTGGCNLRCRNCYAGRGGFEPATGVLQQRMESLYRMGTRIWLLHGGEPTLHPDVVALTTFASRRGYVAISTNGSRPDVLDRIRNADMIQLSLDGTEEWHDTVRGKTGSYQLVIDSANVLKCNQVPFSFHMVLREGVDAYVQIRHVCEIAKRFGTWMVVCCWMPSGTTNENPNDSWTANTYRLMLTLKSAGYPIHNSVDALEHAMTWPLKYGQVGWPGMLPKKHSQCLHGRLTVWVDECGMLYPCTVGYKRNNFTFSNWESMKGLKCVDCGMASELPYLLGLKWSAIRKWLGIL